MKGTAFGDLIGIQRSGSFVWTFTVWATSSSYGRGYHHWTQYLLYFETIPWRSTRNYKARKHQEEESPEGATEHYRPAVSSVFILS